MTPETRRPRRYPSTMRRRMGLPEAAPAVPPPAALETLEATPAPASPAATPVVTAEKQNFLQKAAKFGIDYGFIERTNLKDTSTLVEEPALGGLRTSIRGVLDELVDEIAPTASEHKNHWPMLVQSGVPTALGFGGAKIIRGALATTGAIEGVSAIAATGVSILRQSSSRAVRKDKTVYHQFVSSARKIDGLGPIELAKHFARLLNIGENELGKLNIGLRTSGALEQLLRLTPDQINGLDDTQIKKLYTIALEHMVAYRATDKLGYGYSEAEKTKYEEREKRAIASLARILDIKYGTDVDKKNQVENSSIKEFQKAKQQMWLKQTLINMVFAGAKSGTLWISAAAKVSGFLEHATAAVHAMGISQDTNDIVNTVHVGKHAGLASPLRIPNPVPTATPRPSGWLDNISKFIGDKIKGFGQTIDPNYNPTPGPTGVHTDTPTATTTHTPVATETIQPTHTPTATATETAHATNTPVATDTPAPTKSPVPITAVTKTSVPTATGTPVPKPPAVGYNPERGMHLTGNGDIVDGNRKVGHIPNAGQEILTPVDQSTGLHLAGNGDILDGTKKVGSVTFDSTVPLHPVKTVHANSYDSQTGLHLGANGDMYQGTKDLTKAAQVKSTIVPHVEYPGLEYYNHGQAAVVERIIPPQAPPVPAITEADIQTGIKRMNHIGNILQNADQTITHRLHSMADQISSGLQNIEAHQVIHLPVYEGGSIGQSLVAMGIDPHWGDTAFWHSILEANKHNIVYWQTALRMGNAATRHAILDIGKFDPDTGTWGNFEAISSYGNIMDALHFELPDDAGGMVYIPRSILALSKPQAA